MAAKDDEERPLWLVLKELAAAKRNAAESTRRNGAGWRPLQPLPTDRVSIAWECGAQKWVATPDDDDAARLDERRGMF